MLVTALWLWALCYLVHAENDTSCELDYQCIGSNETFNISACTILPCITKCCAVNQIFLEDEAHGTTDCFDNVNLTLTFNVSNLDDYSGVPIYKILGKRNVVQTTKTIENFTVIYTENFHSSSCSLEIEQNLMYILENGYLVTRRLNYYNQWVDEMAPGEFCVEHQVVLDADGALSKPQLVIRALIDNDVEDENKPKPQILAYGLVVSCVFLALVLAVYALLPELRNMAGLILMAYVATMFSALLIRIVQILNGQLEKTGCIWLGLISYYAILAYFTWMNVMSFDIWWAMRGFRKLRQTQQRGVLVKLCWYGLYGWGAPLLPVLFMIVVENIDMTHLPDFVTPHYSDPFNCYMEEDERQLYMNVPILITLCINITLFLMTAYNIWRIKRGVAQHSAGDSRRNESDETRFGLYVKIALVMGINWITEIVSSLYGQYPSWLWFIPDFLNSFTGVFIFIIFICKSKVIVLLCKRFSVGDELVRKWQPVDSKCFQDSRVNSRRKILNSVTETSDVEDVGKGP